MRSCRADISLGTFLRLGMVALYHAPHHRRNPVVVDWVIVRTERVPVRCYMWFDLKILFAFRRNSTNVAIKYTHLKQLQYLLKWELSMPAICWTIAFVFYAFCYICCQILNISSWSSICFLSHNFLWIRNHILELWYFWYVIYICAIEC